MSNEPKHTPGPWRAQEHNGCKNIHAKKSGANRQGQWFYEVACTPGLNDDAEDLANARLIAAAPELLSALQGVVAVADRQTVDFDRARAAIAKALGNGASSRPLAEPDAVPGMNK